MLLIHRVFEKAQSTLTIDFSLFLSPPVYVDLAVRVSSVLSAPFPLSSMLLIDEEYAVLFHLFVANAALHAKPFDDTSSLLPTL